MNQNDLNYYRNERPALSKHVSLGSNRVLDVGCGSGNFGASLKASGRASEVYGIELMPHAAEEAARRLDDVVCANLDSLSLPDLRNKWRGSFDYVVCADVLEHVKDPWQVLGELVQFLGPGGKVVVSIPNVRHWKVVSSLLFDGQWTYRDSGIMDRTHLRFFTKASSLEMLEGARLDVRVVQPLIGGRWRTLSALTAHAIDEFLAIQYVLVGVRTE